MNVDCRWLGTSVGRVRILLAGLVLVAAGCMVLGWGSRSRQLAVNSAGSMVATALPSGEAKGTPVYGTAAYGTPAHALSVFAGLPLMFEPNLGQANLDPADPRARFMARGSGYSLLLGSGGAILRLSTSAPTKPGAAKPTLRSEWLQMKLAGADPDARLTAIDPLPGKSNYLLGNDPAKWKRGVPQFARVRYENVYPGINLVFYGNQGVLEYDFQVAPGSDPARAELEFSGAKQVELKEGALVVKGERGSVRLNAPKVYQEIAGRRQPVDGSFVLRGDRRAGFAIGAYDHSRELIIDPEVNFATYFGGSGNELSTSVAVDGSGNLYLTGSTTSPNLPVGSTVIQKTLKTPTAQNIYVAKITPPLGAMVATLDYVTYLGGSDSDSPVGIAVDVSGNPYVAGTTFSQDFPTTPTAYQNGPETGSTGTTHVFVTELNGGPNPAPASELLYSSYLSGNGTDAASGMTIDSQGNLYVTGTTTSQDTGTGVQFPASSLPYGQPFQSAPKSSIIQFFVTKVNTLASRAGSIAYSTYFGGGTFDTAQPIATGGGIVVDTNLNIYFTGTTNFIYVGQNGTQLSDFPILNAYQPCLDQAAPTVIINPQTCKNTTTTSNSDAFVAKLNPAGPAGSGQLVWSTYLGGMQTDSGTGIALDTAGNVYVTGTTNSPDVTTTTTFGAYQRCLNQPNVALGTACPTTDTANDAFVAKLTNPTSSTATNMSLAYFSYLGGGGDEAGLAIATDNASGALVTGWTRSTNPVPFPVFPTPNPIQSTLNGTQNAFVARLNTAAQTGNNTTGSWANYYGGSVIDEGTSITLDVNGNIYFAGDTTSPDLHLAEQLPANAGGDYNGGSDAFVTQLGTASTLSIIGCIAPCTSQSQPFVSAGTSATFTYTLTNNGPDLANGITVTDNLTNTGVSLTVVSASATSGTCSGGGSTSTSVSCNIPILQSGSTATVTIVLTPTASNTGNGAQFTGGTVTVTGQNNIILAEATVPAYMTDFTLTAGPSNFTVPIAGDTAPYEVQLTPHPVYGGTNISLSCSGVPTGATCNFTTATVTLTGASPGSSTLNITTQARPIITPTASLMTRHFYAFWLCVPGLALFGLGSNRRRRKVAGMLLLCTVFAMLLLLPACSTSPAQAPVSGTPTGTYQITIIATAGSDTKNTFVTLTVP